jgi:hypothetical protein
MQELYDFLKSYGLGTRGKVEKRLNKFSERKLNHFLESYLNLARKRHLVRETPLGATDIYLDSWHHDLPLSLIKQLGIYANQFYLHDPLVALALNWEHFDPAVVVKFPSQEGRLVYRRSELAHKLEHILELQPLAVENICHLIATELVQPKRQVGKLYADDLFGPGGAFVELTPEIPPGLKSYIHNNAKVFPAKFENNEPIVLEGELLSPRRMIAVKLFGESAMKFYQLFSITPDNEQDSENSEPSGYSWNTYFDIKNPAPVDKSTFEHWVEGSRNKTVLERIERLQHDLSLAALAKAKFLTSSPVTRDIASLNMAYPVKDGQESDVVKALLQLELPYLDNANFSTIAKARKNEAAFEEFRLALDKAFKEIESLPNTPEFQDEVNQVIRDLLLVPVAKIDQRIKSLRRSLFIDILISAGSLVSTLIMEGNTLVSAAALFAGAKALEAYKKDKEVEDEIKQSSSYFYWEATRKKR